MTSYFVSEVRFRKVCFNALIFLLLCRLLFFSARLLHFLRVRLGIHGEHLLGVLAKQGLYLHDSFLGRDWRAFHLSLDDISTSIRINFRCGLSSSWAHVCGKKHDLAEHVLIAAVVQIDRIRWLVYERAEKRNRLQLAMAKMGSWAIDEKTKL